MKIGSFDFELVEEFRYLGTVVNGLNEMGSKVDQYIEAGKRVYFVYRNQEG